MAVVVVAVFVVAGVVVAVVLVAVVVARAVSVTESGWRGQRSWDCGVVQESGVRAGCS